MHEGMGMAVQGENQVLFYVSTKLIVFKSASFDLFTRSFSIDINYENMKFIFLSCRKKLLAKQ